MVGSPGDDLEAPAFERLAELSSAVSSIMRRPGWTGEETATRWSSFRRCRYRWKTTAPAGAKVAPNGAHRQSDWVGLISTH